MTANTNAALPDAVRVPLDSLHADASYLIGRLQRGTMTAGRVVEVIRDRIDAAKAALAAQQAAPVAQGDASPTMPRDIEMMATNRYRPVPSGVLAYKVVGGDGNRSLFSGTKDECQIVARKLTEAFLDGAHVALTAHPAAPVAQGDARAPGLIAAAEHIEGMAAGYIEEHAYTEPDTGAVVFDRRDAGLEYHSTLVELAEDLRGMAARSQAKEGVA